MLDVNPQSCSYHCVVVPWPALLSLFTIFDALVQELGDKEDDLNATYNGEPWKESHCSSNETYLSFNLDLFVSLDVVKGCRVKVDPDKSEVGLNRNVNSWSTRILFDKRGKLNSNHSW